MNRLNIWKFEDNILVDYLLSPAKLQRDFWDQDSVEHVLICLWAGTYNQSGSETNAFVIICAALTTRDDRGWRRDGTDEKHPIKLLQETFCFSSLIKMSNLLEQSMLLFCHLLGKLFNTNHFSDGPQKDASVLLWLFFFLWGHQMIPPRICHELSVLMLILSSHKQGCTVTKLFFFFCFPECLSFLTALCRWCGSVSYIKYDLQPVGLRLRWKLVIQWLNCIIVHSQETLCLDKIKLNVNVIKIISGPLCPCKMYMFCSH